MASADWATATDVSKDSVMIALSSREITASWRLPSGMAETAFMPASEQSGLLHHFADIGMPREEPLLADRQGTVIIHIFVGGER